MASEALARAACESYAAYLALGHEVLEGPGVRVVRHAATRRVYDANHLQRVSASTPAGIEAVLAFAEEALAGLGHRQVFADPWTPAPFQARLALEGYAPKPTLQMVLGGPLAGAAPEPGVAIRAVDSAADWASLRALLRADHVETCAREGRPVYEDGVTDELLDARRAKAPALRYWLAALDGRDRGFFSSWPGTGGVGLVEDLFTDPAARKRGVARALVHHAVADARARGARAVLIGARPDDTPKRFYASLGFEPVCLTWAWLRAPHPPPPGGSAPSGGGLRARG